MLVCTFKLMRHSPGASGGRLGEPVEAGAQLLERVGGGQAQVVHRLERRAEEHCERLLELRLNRRRQHT